MQTGNDPVAARKALGWTTLADARSYASDQVIAYAAALGDIDEWIDGFARACWDAAAKLDVGKWIEEQIEHSEPEENGRRMDGW